MSRDIIQIITVPLINSSWKLFLLIIQVVHMKIALHTSPHRGLCNYKTPITQYLGAWRFQCYRVNTRLAFNIRMKNALWETKNKKMNVTERECLPWKASLSPASWLVLSVNWCTAKSVERETLEWLLQRWKYSRNLAIYLKYIHV